MRSAAAALQPLAVARRGCSYLLVGLYDDMDGTRFLLSKLLEPFFVKVSRPCVYCAQSGGHSDTPDYPQIIRLSPECFSALRECGNCCRLAQRGRACCKASISGGIGTRLRTNHVSQRTLSIDCAN